MFEIENLLQNVGPAGFNITDASVHLHEGPTTDGPPAARPPVNIVQDDQTVYAHFRWKHDGWLVKLLAPGCKYECSVYLEHMGQGETAANPTPQTVNFGSTPGQSFSLMVPISGLQEGVYKIVATLLMRSPSGKPTPVASYQDLGILQVYQDN